MSKSDFYHSVLLPKILTIWQAENKLTKHFQNSILIGVDEAGRGPLAGSVVAAAVVLKESEVFRLCQARYAELPIQDSKKLSEKQREQAFADLPKYCAYHSTGEASVTEIEDIGILNATFLAMRRALEPIILKLEEKKMSFKILVDGNLYIREIDEALQMPIIKGDGRVASISAASIFAKVSRDREMIKLDEQYPQYGFKAHKGYGTKAHLEAIREFGQCKIHRKNFKTN